MSRAEIFNALKLQQKYLNVLFFERSAVIKSDLENFSRKISREISDSNFSTAAAPSKRSQAKWGVDDFSLNSSEQFSYGLEKMFEVLFFR